MAGNVTVCEWLLNYCTNDKKGETVSLCSETKLSVKYAYICCYDIIVPSTESLECSKVGVEHLA